MSAGNPAYTLHGVTAEVSAEPTNPWLGLASYTEQDYARFFGRDREIAEVRRLIEREALTVVFGRSGLGKTSLLRAGVIPQLRESLYFPIALRLDYSGQGLSPVQQLKALAREAALVAGVQLENDPQDDPDATLWEFFHTAEFWSPRNDQLTPILLIDQFEEVFTIGRNVRAAGEFLEELGDLIENRIPRPVQEHVERSGQPLGIDAGTRNYKVVLSLREDFVSKLDSLRSGMPSVMRNRFSLDPLSGERALAVILQGGAGGVAEDVARDIVAAVAGGAEGNVLSPEFAAHAEIEPAYLSVMCHELFQRMVALGRSTITRDLVQQEHGGILEGLYERSFEGLGPKARLFVEDRLLTAGGFRAAVPVAEALHEGMTEQTLDTLVDRRLLRFEDRLGVSHVELSHDLLTGVVLRSRDQRRSRESLEREARRQAELRRAFRARVRTALAGAVAAALVLGGLGYWALHEQKIAILATKEAAAKTVEAAATSAAAEKEKKQADDATQKAAVQIKDAQTEMLRADDEMKALKVKTTGLLSGMGQQYEKSSSAVLQAGLKELDTWRSTTEKSDKDKLSSSLGQDKKNLQDYLDSVEGGLKVEPDNQFLRSAKISLLYALADFEAQVYGYDDDKYRAFISYAQAMLNEKDPWLQVKALRGIGEAAGIMARKPDPAAAKTLLDEVRLRGGQLQSGAGGRGLSAEMWDVLEDAYEDCATLQENRDPKDASAWYLLAVQAETKATELDKKYSRDVARISQLSADFEKGQGNYDAAIREYTATIKAYKDSIPVENAGKPDRESITPLIDRGDAEYQAFQADKTRKDYADAARKDYEESAALVDKLDASSDNRYQKLVVSERLGDLIKADDPKKALDLFRQEKQIALDLASGDTSRRMTVAAAYARISNALLALGDTKGARAELEEQVSKWQDWTQGSLVESDEQAYLKARLALGEFDFQQKDYEAAQKSFDSASTTAVLLVIKWTNSANMTLLVRNSTELAQVYEQLKQPDSALKTYQDAKPFAKDTIAEDCEGSIDQFNSFVTMGTQSLIDLKRFDDALAEGKDAMQLVEQKCTSIGANSSPEVKTTMAQFWGNLSWGFVRSGGYDLAITCAQRGLALDATQTWIDVNLAHAYLFSGRVSDAENLYSEIKDKPWGDHLLRQDIRNDFKELSGLGKHLPAMDTILDSLGPDHP
jgi:hypothetical protein